jgi:hypothetical protein
MLLLLSVPAPPLKPVLASIIIVIIITIVI